MVEPPIPADDEQRVEDLRRLDMLLTTPEEVFDKITRELARIFEVTGVMMSFIDEDTQYYKSAIGLPPEIAATRTEPREISICGFVVGTNQMLVVDDLLADERFRDNPIVLSSGARFYAGTPLRADTGRAVGTLCIVDEKPRTMGGREQDLLRVIAEGVMAQIKLQFASRQLLDRTKQIESDLHQAERMQRFLLPPACVEGGNWRISHLYQPFEHLGGDFVDVHRRPDGRLAVLVADVAGHGTSAALTMAMAKGAFHRVAPRVAATADLLNAIHHQLVGIVPPEQFMTALAALLDPDGRQVKFASAGHPYPMKVHDGQVEAIRQDNEIPLLVDLDQEYTKQATVELPPGDRLLVYTDGAMEAADPDGNRLDLAGLSRLVKDVVGERPDDLLAGLMSHLRRYTGNRFEDDVALVCIESV
jgi:serine phosphatase RsbU (regulator of sigma subunit)